MTEANDKPDDKAASESKPKEAEDSSSQPKLTAHHVSKLLDEVLDDDQEGTKTGYRHPIVIDLVLIAGLLVAMGGFTVGMFRMYVTHAAQQNITNHNYEAAINLLSGNKFGSFFTSQGAGDPEEILDQALYLDAFDRLKSDPNDRTALKELERIKPGSACYFEANDILTEHAEPAQLTLQGGAQHDASPDEIKEVQNRPKLPEMPKDAVP